MKRILIVIAVLFASFAISCTGSGKKNGEVIGYKFYTELPTQEAMQNKVSEVLQEEITDSELDNMVKNFVFPPKSPGNLNFDEECKGLPINLINQLKEAIYYGNSDTLIQELNDRSLMITVDDFDFEPNRSNDIDTSEKDLNNAIRNGASDFLIYNCDTNGDGTDEIIMIQNLQYDYSYSNCAYILKRDGDKYVYAGYDYLGYYRCFALLENNEKFYIIANYDDYDTKTTKAVGLFALDGDNNGFMWLINNKQTYIRKTNDGYRYNLLYKNIKEPIVSNLETYISEIGTDLVYTDRTHRTFYGDETEKNDSIPTPTQYFLTQRWFKTINGKTIIFSLYHKDSEDIYMLDARISENGQTTILLDYMINLETNIELSDYWDYDDTNFEEIEYTDSDIEKAFPEDIDKKTDRLAEKVQGDFVAVNYKHKDIPNGLIVLAEKALFYNNIDLLNLGSSSFEISSADFYDVFGQYTGFDNKEEFDRYVAHIYQYDLDNSTYYISVVDSGGTARFVDINLYKKSNGELTVLNNWVSLDINARVIMYNHALYFIESSYNYYSKYTDTIYIYRLGPEQIKDYVTIELQPNHFEWEDIYSNHLSYEKSISSYVDSIKSDLMDKSPINDNIQVYMGDENNKFSKDKLLRLKSVGGNYEYNEIDFNNDGEPEYFDRRFWFPSTSTILYLMNNVYRFTDKRTITINGDFDRDGSTLIQLWFKEIDGKVFTFRLFLNDGYNYCLNVSLIENTNITQVQSYLIVPKNGFNISTQEWEE